MPPLIHLATILAAHGLKGEVKIKSFCAEPAALARYKGLQRENGEPCRLKIRAGDKDVLIAALEGVTTRTEAEALAKAKTRLYAPREDLGKAKRGQYFYEDLKGLAALDETGAKIAQVTNVMNSGAGDILELKGEAGTFMLPFAAPFAGDVDLEAGTLKIMIPEGWLTATPDKPPRKPKTGKKTRPS